MSGQFTKLETNSSRSHTCWAIHHAHAAVGHESDVLWRALGERVRERLHEVRAGRITGEVGKHALAGTLWSKCEIIAESDESIGSRKRTGRY